MAIVPFKSRMYPGIFRIGVVRLQVPCIKHKNIFSSIKMDPQNGFPDPTYPRIMKSVS